VSYSNNGFRTFQPKDVGGRYLEADPIGLWGGLNPYVYAGNNPYVNTDPSGLVIGVDDAAEIAEASSLSLLGYAWLQANAPWVIWGGTAAVEGTLGFYAEGGGATRPVLAEPPITPGATCQGPEAARGLSNLGGVLSSEPNAAGGAVVTSSGLINQNDIVPFVNGGLYRGNVNIITGVHGEISGAMTPDISLYESDMATFGHLPDVTVHNLPLMTPQDIRSVLNGPGTTIGAFCNSGICLAPYR
jgi:uncharacterized protein RhaS with RHS repeats